MRLNGLVSTDLELYGLSICSLWIPKSGWIFHCSATVTRLSTLEVPTSRKCYEQQLKKHRMSFSFVPPPQQPVYIMNSTSLKL